MTRLLRAELMRYWSRRAIRATALLMVAGILFAGFIVALNSSDDPAEIAHGREMQRQVTEDCIEFFEGPVPEGYESVEEFCEEENRAAGFDPRFHLVQMQDVLGEMTFLLVIVAIGLGATFVGAEWGAGTMTTILTWEPRRIRVYAMKVLAGMIFVFIAMMLVQAFLVLTMTPVAAWRGSLEGVDAEWLGDVTWLAMRSALVCAVMATIGMALAMIARVTVAAVIVAFIYFAVVENVIRAYRPNWSRWLFGDNLVMFVFGEGEAGGGFEMTTERALFTLLGYGAIFFLGSLAMFRSRDVT